VAPIGTKTVNEVRNGSQAGEIEQFKTHFRAEMLVRDQTARPFTFSHIARRQNQFRACSRQRERNFIAESTGCPGYDSQLSGLRRYVGRSPFYH
jgi:hypothetical protein